MVRYRKALSSLYWPMLYFPNCVKGGFESVAHLNKGKFVPLLN